MAWVLKFQESHTKRSVSEDNSSGTLHCRRVNSNICKTQAQELNSQN